MRLGLAPFAPRTLRKVAEALGLTRERVRQIEGLALCKLTSALVDNQRAVERVGA
jgi:RNA polymerase primary sigma factor